MQVPELIVAEYENLEVKPLFGMIGLKIASLWMHKSGTSKIRNILERMERRENGLVGLSIRVSCPGAEHFPG